MTPPLVVLDVERPLLLHLLGDVQDGRDDVAPRLVQVGDQGGPGAMASKAETKCSETYFDIA